MRNARLFGSVAKGTDKEGSDLDILVDAPLGTTSIHLCGIQIDLEDLLGVPVDVQTPNEFGEKSRARVLAEALPL